MILSEQNGNGIVSFLQWPHLNFRKINGKGRVEEKRSFVSFGFALLKPNIQGTPLGVVKSRRVVSRIHMVGVDPNSASRTFLWHQPHQGQVRLEMWRKAKLVYDFPGRINAHSAKLLHKRRRARLWRERLGLRLLVEAHEFLLPELNFFGRDPEVAQTRETLWPRGELRVRFLLKSINEMFILRCFDVTLEKKTDDPLFMSCIRI